MNLDRDHDPDRLVEAWLDEGPRTFSPGLLDRTLAEIHGTRQQRQRPLPWSPPRMNLTFLTGLAGAAVLAVLFAATAFLPWLPSTFFGPAGSPTPSPTLVTTPVPHATSEPSPAAPTFLAGDVPFEGTDWLLVGRIDGTRVEGDPTYVSAVGDRPATLRFLGGVLDGSDGCFSLTGTFDADPRGARTAPADITLDPTGDVEACPEPERSQHLALRERLDGAGGVQLTTGGYEVLASDLTDADLDAALLAHFQANPDLARLIIRDQSGEGTLIYAPIGRPSDGSTGPELLTEPQPLLETDWRIEAVTDGVGGLAAVPLESEAAIRLKRVGDADRFDAYDGCESVQGDFAMGPQKGSDGITTFQLVLSSPEVGSCNRITLEQGRAILSALGEVGSIEAIDRVPDPGALGLSRDRVDVRLQRALAADPRASRQLLRDRTGTPILLLVAAAPSDPRVPTSPAPGSSPTFLAGEVPFEGTDWLLVGHAGGGADTEGPALVSPGVQAWLRFEGERFSGSSGCYGIYGPVWERPDGDAVTPVDLLPIPLNDYGCRSAAAIDEDAVITGLLEQVETFQLTRGGPENLGSGLSEADLDPTFAAHLREHPDVPRLVLGDESGAVTLVYAPVAAGYVVEPPPVRGSSVDLVGPRWGLAGWWTGTEVGYAESTRGQSLRFAPDGTFAGSTGCGTVTGRWGTVVGDTVEPGPWVVDQERLAGACDTGQPAAILALLRTVDPETISVTADLAAELPASWQGDSANHLVRDVTYLLLRDGSGEPVLAYWVLSEDDPTATVAPSPSASPTTPPTFVAGDVPLQGTTWQLVGRIDDGRADGDPAYISPVGDRPATLRFDRNGTFGGHTGCHAIGGSWDATPRNERTFPADLQLEGALRANACAVPLDAQDVGVRGDLDGSGAMQLTRESYQTLASGLTEADLDPPLLAHFQASPDLLRLIVRDQSGEGSLIYAPVVPDVSSLTGRTWGIAGYRTEAGLVDAGDADAVTVRFDDDGTFTAADGCGTLGGVWGEAVVADGPPIAGETDVDVQNQWCLDGRSQDVLRVLQDLELRNGVARTADLRAVVDGESVPDGLVSRIAERGEALVLRDPDDRPALVLVPSERSPSPSPSAAPSAEPLAFHGGDQVPDDTTWVVMGYLAQPTGPDEALLYRAVGDGLRPWVRFDGTGWSTGDTGCDRFVARRSRDGGPSDLIDIIDLSSTDCGIAQARVAMRVMDLLEQASWTDRTSQVLEPAEVEPRQMQVEAALQAHFDATPGLQRMALRDSDGIPLLMLAPIDGGLPGVPGSDPAVDPAPQSSAFVRIAFDRAGLGDGPWQVIGRRDASGRLRLASPTEPAIIALGDGGAISGSTGCDLVTGAWQTTGDPDETGWRPAQVTMERGSPSTDTCTSVQADELATMLELPIGGLRLAAETIEAMRVQPDFPTMDPWLWAWLAANPNLPMLTLTDAAGVPQLILAPIDG
jgi:heat shock protein HslJ